MISADPARLKPGSHRAVFLSGAAIVLAGAVVYSRTFAAPFLFDDEPSILDNPTIKHLWPLWSALSPPSAFGVTVSGRPLVNVSLAVNYAISGFNVWSYHALNLLIHLLGGLTLFGLVRRTLLRPGLAEKFGAHALPAAFAAALLWTVHPLQTESVTYLIQRAEALMGLFYLLTLYCFVRSVEGESDAATTELGGRGRAARVADEVTRQSAAVDPRPRGPASSTAPNGRERAKAKSRIWRAGAIFACLLGTGCKEVIVTAPLVVWLYDRTFVAGSFGAAWRQRAGFYAWLLLTWVPLAWFVVHAGGDRGGTFVLTLAAFRQYWLTQFEAVTRYVGLALWPHPLIFDYGVPAGYPAADAVAFAFPVLILVGTAAWTLWRRKVWGFFAASFLLALAPTSAVPGMSQYIVEHRMYLPLAAVVVGVASALTAWLGRAGLIVLLALATGYGSLTLLRNSEYKNDLVLWESSVLRRPQSAKAQSNFGRALYLRGRVGEAIGRYEAAIQLDSVPAQPQYNLGLALDDSGRVEEAIPHYAEAVRALPRFMQAHFKLGADLVKVGRRAEAIPHFEAAAAANPNTAEAHRFVGQALAELERFPEAVRHYEEALRLQPDDATTEGNLGAALYRMGRPTDAVRHLQRALQLDPTMAEAHYNLGLSFAATGRAEEAVAQYTEVVRIDPKRVEAHLNWGILLAQQGRLAKAQDQLVQATKLRPDLAAAHGNLGIVLAELGHLDEAVRSYGEALRLQPDYPAMHYNLGNALLRLGRWAEAKRHFEEASRLQPDFAPAREMLEQLRKMPFGP